MSRSTLIATTCFVIGLVINPAYFVGCASLEVEARKFDYGEEEMLGLLDEINETRAWTIESDGLTYQIELELTQAVEEDRTAAAYTVPRAAWSQRAHACGTRRRMFGATASACATLYETLLPLTGTLRISRLDDAEAVLLTEIALTGRLAVKSHRFEDGYLELSLKGEDATFASSGSTTDGLAQGTFRVRDESGEPLEVQGELAPISASAG